MKASEVVNEMVKAELQVTQYGGSSKRLAATNGSLARPGHLVSSTSYFELLAHSGSGQTQKLFTSELKGTAGPPRALFRLKKESASYAMTAQTKTKITHCSTAYSYD